MKKIVDKLIINRYYEKVKKIDRTKNLEETINEDSAEGEVAGNSQAKGPDSDDTLERDFSPTKQLQYIFEANLSGKKTETHNKIFL